MIKEAIKHNAQSCICFNKSLKKKKTNLVPPQLQSYRILKLHLIILVNERVVALQLPGML